MSKPSENAAWITSLQSTVSELVTELFSLLGSGEAGKSCIPLTNDFPTFEQQTIYLETFELHEASFNAINSLVSQSPNQNII